MTEKMTLARILEEHPKGIQYGGILKQFKRYPVLIDSMDRVLSFPPIINSLEIGEVKTNTRNVLVEVTGTDQRMVALTLNILATSLYDRGAEIDPVLVACPYATDMGKNITFPADTSTTVTLALERFSRALGEEVTVPELKRRLTAYGHRVRSSGKALKIVCPPYRDDMMHPIDMVEDYAISRGYDSFDAVMPKESTVGGLTSLELLSDTVRGHMVGAGFQEFVSNILCSREELADVLPEGERLIEVDNIMSLAYSVVRHSALPSLLNVESASSKAFYPHRTFEVGEVAVPDSDSNMGTRTDLNLAALISHPAANFSELHSVLDVLLYYLGIEYKLEPSDHPAYIPGRCGKVRSGETVLGYLGEVRPEVLEKRQIAMPCAAFEINLNRIKQESSA